MSNSIKYVLIFLAAFSLFSGCSRKKDRFLNRNWHSLNTKYNVLYNGSVAMEEGLKSLETTYSDNYWSILPVEPLKVSESFSLEEKKSNPDFETAEEKAIKAVQTHGMNIRGKEKNPQIDEAYMLLGKSRYYSGRFIPALEAFNYILFKYPGSSNINSAKIWRAKTNLRLDNEATALGNLNKLLNQKELSRSDKVEATAALAQLYINRNELDSALVYLKSSSSLTKNNTLKGRLFFIEGQVYNLKSETDSANLAFQKVIDLNRKIPRVYRINAFLEQIKNFEYNNGHLDLLEAHLRSIENNRENRPFLDRIYHVIANHYQKLEKDSLAISYYNKSLKTDSKDPFLTAKNYNTIADIYFDASEYSLAGTYYDSTLVNYPPNSKFYRDVKKRLDNLQDVILYESIAQRNDSILKLTTLDKKALETYFQNIIDQLNSEEKTKNKVQTPKYSTATGSNPSSQSNLKGGFYFYQPTTVAYGKNEFIRNWGDRPLEDNWRWSKKINFDQSQEISVEANEIQIKKDTLTTAYYIEQIPKAPRDIDSISKQRNFAYYQLGLIYKNKFKDYHRSREKLEFLTQHNTEERLKLPILYNLYKLYQLMAENQLSDEVKNRIITTHPNSRYAQILLNPTIVIHDNQSPEARYETLFQQFLDNQFEKVITECNLEITRLEGEAIVPKLELLKASAEGRLFGFAAYKKGLNDIVLNYPNSEEGKQATDILLELNQRLSNPIFETDDSEHSYKTVFEFDSDNNIAIDDFFDSISKAIKEEKVLNLSVSKDVYDINTTFVVVHGLKSIDGAKGFIQLLDIENSDVLSKPSFAISTQNYTTLQIHKNLDYYKEWINN